MADEPTTKNVGDPIGLGDRPDIYFIQTQYLPWEPYGMRGEGCQRRRLSQDAKTGAETYVMMLVPGYKLDGPVFLESDLEFYVLYGEIEINGRKYHRDCYGVHPAGYAHNTFSSSSGATVIVITLGGPDSLHRGPPKIEFNRLRLVEILDTWEMPWLDNSGDWYPEHPHQTPKPLTSAPAIPGTFYKTLWNDPDTKAHTFLWAGLPHTDNPSQCARTHTVDEEMFVLQGTYTFVPEGVMYAGAYVNWKGMRTHGTYGSELGWLKLSKFYGPIGNILYRDQPIPFTYDPGFKPTLPPELAKYAKPVDLPKWFDQTLKA